MPLIRYQPEPIEIPIGVHSPSGLDMVARFIEIQILDEQVKLRVMVYFFKDGIRLTGQGFAPYEKILVADNNTLVDVTPGEAMGTILHVRTSESFPEMEEIANSFEQPTMFEGEFFRYLRDTQAVQVTPLIMGTIQKAIVAGKFHS